jgi:uncharacterized membrane protein (DUF485 family)
MSVKGRPNPDFPELEELLARSVVGQMVDRCVRFGELQLRGSHVLTAVGRRVQDYRSLALTDRIRFAGVLLMTFAVTYFGLLTLVVPLRSAPVAPAIVSVIPLAIGLLLVIGASALERAWVAKRPPV